MLALYGHPFSSYTWKAQIAFHAGGVDHEFREVGPEHAENGEFLVTHGGPWGKFPVLVDGETILFESTVIIEHLALHHAPGAGLIPADPAAALATRMLDRVFDNYVMAPMQAVVDEHLRSPADPDAARCAEARGRLERSYAWLEAWLAGWDRSGPTTLVECAAAPALFYAHWVEPIGPDFPLLRAWRKQLNHRPEVARCIAAARPFRGNFPPGAPEED
ncbi:glutathione S-transferase family protein [Novosphingobium bradum]|uniref:Glutathione S-transferase family protein n=1 Tax=Novosphingobium bradum TaxID=1737444 RepID=A0ABV7IX27_9SPHN